LNSPFFFKVLLAEKLPIVAPEVWLRVVIQFVEYKIKVWITQETSATPEELNKELRDQELQKKGFYDV